MVDPLLSLYWIQLNTWQSMGLTHTPLTASRRCAVEEALRWVRRSPRRSGHGRPASGVVSWPSSCARDCWHRRSARRAPTGRRGRRPVRRHRRKESRRPRHRPRHCPRRGPSPLLLLPALPAPPAPPAPPEVASGCPAPASDCDPPTLRQRRTCR